VWNVVRHFQGKREKEREKSTVFIQLLFWRENYHLFQMIHIVAFLWLATLRYLSRKDYVTNQTNAYRGYLWVVQKYDRREGLPREFCPRTNRNLRKRDAMKWWKSKIKVVLFIKRKMAEHSWSWVQTKNNLIVSLMIHNKSYDMYLFFIYSYAKYNLLYSCQTRRSF